MKTSHCDSPALQAGSLRMTQAVDYGLFLLSVLSEATSVKPLSLSVVAEENDLSFSFLQKIARVLRKAGFVSSVRGKSGGYYLARGLDSLSVREVIEVIEGPISLAACTSSRGVCSRSETCSVRHGLNQVQREVHNLLYSKKLSELFS